MSERKSRVNRKSRAYSLSEKYLKERALAILEPTRRAARRFENAEPRSGSFVDIEAFRVFADKLSVEVAATLASGGLRDFRLPLPEKPHLSDAIWNRALISPTDLPLSICSEPTENGWKRTIIWARITKGER